VVRKSRQSRKVTRFVTVPHMQRRPGKPTPARNEEVAAILARRGWTHAQAASYLSERLAREVKAYHIGRTIAGQRSPTVDEMDALRALDAPNPGEYPPSINLQRLTDEGEAIPLFSADPGAGRPLRLREDGRIGVASVHPAQKGYKSVFAIVVTDEVFGERIRIGDIAYGVKNKVPAQGQPCLVARGEMGCVLGYFDTRDAQTVIVRQGPRGSTVSVPMRDVTGLHTIVGVTFGG
jgi:hypothetical protein